ncbi:MAG: DnaJ domain-containing protein [Cytophagales bacterium]
MKDYYKILNVRSSASSAEIKQSFRKLAMVYHPDRSIENDSHERFIEINEAYEILSDSILRTQYDQMLNNSAGDMFVEHEYFKEKYNQTRNVNRTDRVYRATRKTKDVITPYVCKTYVIAAYFSVAFMALLLLDIVLPNLTTSEKVVEAKFGADNIMEYVVKTKSNNIIVEQDDFNKFKEGETIVYECSSIFGFDKNIYKNVNGETVTIPLPGDFSKLYTFFIAVNAIMAYLTIKSKSETEILQFGTANFYLTIIMAVCVFFVY